MVLYLLSLFSFESATFVGQRFERTYTGDYIIKNSIISDVDNNLIGGSIFLDNPNGNIKFLNTVFLRCSTSKSSNSAGAISIFNASLIQFVGLCFNRCCSSQDATNFQICAYIRLVKMSYYNSSVEVDSNKGKYISMYASHIGGTDLVSVTGINNTRNVLPSKHEFGIVFGASFNSKVMFCLFDSGRGTHIIRYYKTDYFHNVENCIFKNNSASYLHTSEPNVRYHQCIFVANSINDLKTGAGTLTLSGCIFDNDFSMKSFTSEGQNLFLATTYTSMLFLIDNCFESVSANLDNFVICNTYPGWNIIRISSIIVSFMIPILE